MSELPSVRLRALTAADIPALHSWGGIPEPFLGIAELLEAALIPGTITWLAEDPQGHVVAVFQAAPEEDGERSVALLVHPGRRGTGYGTACVLAAMSEPWLAAEVLTATIDRSNVASLRCFTRCGFHAEDDASSRTYAGLVYRPPSCSTVIASGAPSATLV
jgi:RimJ/RimL family protein N-acetyltransferase